MIVGNSDAPPHPWCQASPEDSPQPERTSHQKALLVLGDVEARRQVRYTASADSQLKLVMVAKWELATEALHRTCGPDAHGSPPVSPPHRAPPPGCPSGDAVIERGG